MATKKQPPAAGKPRSKTPKVFDVARPGHGQITASGTSKPVIVNNHALMQDPMVNDEPSQELAAPILKAVKKIVIKPVHDDVIPEDEVISVTSAASEVVSAEAPEPEQETIPFSQASKGNPTQASKVADDQLLIGTKGQAATVGAAADALKPAGVPEAVRHDKQLSPQQAEAALKAAQARNAELEQMIEKEEYFLPINVQQERKSRRFAILGLLVVILLGLAWYDTALDAGLINNMYNLPHTHFFSVK